MRKTGECYFRDEFGNLWIAESFVDNNDYVTTQQTQLEFNNE